ncbi:MAG: DUF3962 domain-containing protein [Opitutales bacterium]|nr:DUF3962 domain-containing protein [Opitutales bacterium]
MSKEYRQITTLSWIPAAPGSSLPFSHSVMPFPSQWKGVSATQDRSLPTRSLNSTLRCLAPDLIAIDPKADRMGSSSWLRTVSPGSLPPGVLALIMNEWALRQEKGAIGHIDADLLRWESREVDLLAGSTTANGTFACADPASFSLIPHWAASRITDPAQCFEYGGQILRFRRVASSPGSGPVEVVSWPALSGGIDKDTGKPSHFYSILLTFSLQTRPFESLPHLHMSVGVRRWLSRPVRKKYIPTNTSVDILAHVPWIQGMALSPAFAVANLRGKRYVESEGKPVDWDNQLPALLTSLGALQTLPDPKALLASPLEFLQEDRGPVFAVRYDHAFGGNHFVNPGSVPLFNDSLSRQIDALLAPVWVRESPFPKIKPSGKAWRMVKRTLPPQGAAELHVECYTARSFIRKALLKAVADITGNSPIPSYEDTLDWNGNRIHIHNGTRDPSRWMLMESLVIPDEKGKNHSTKVQLAESGRIQEIARMLPPVHDQLTLALIQIGDRESYLEKGISDPKASMREGFARTGRLTQFITPDEKGIEHRSMKAFLDALRQAGFAHPISRVGDSDHPSQWNQVGLYQFRIKDRSAGRRPVRFLPVFVALGSDSDSTPQVYLPEWGWMSYPRALLALASKKTPALDRNAVLPWLQNAITNQIVPSGPSLLFVEAQNIRSIWPWLQDPRIGSAHPFGGPSGLDDLRILRVRTHVANETPDAYGSNEGHSGIGRPSGVFVLNPGRVYASFAMRPDAMNTTSLKADPVTKPTGNRWNPNLYEFTLARLEPGDCPDTLALWAHHLRSQSLQYHGDDTALPLPLHLAKGMQEYLPNHEPDDDPEAEA